MPPGLWLRAATLLPLPRCAAARQCSYKNNRRPAVHIELRERNSSHTVGLVVEYSPATGETRVRFPDVVNTSFAFFWRQKQRVRQVGNQKKLLAYCCVLITADLLV